MISIDPDQHGWWAQWVDGRLNSCGQWPCHLDYPDTAVIETQVIIPKFTKRPADIITLAHCAGAFAAAFGYPHEEPSRVKWVAPRSWKGNTKKPTSRKCTCLGADVNCSRCRGKGTISPSWTSYAIHRLVIEALDPREVAIYTVGLDAYPPGERHNLADAVGIGLHELGRLPQPRTESPRRAERMAALAETLRRQAS